jgi:hypothetical protein
MTTGVRLAAEEHAAIRTWHAWRWLEERGDLGFTAQVTRPSTRRGLPAASKRPMAVLVGVYAPLMLVVGVLAGRRRWRLTHITTCAVLVLLLACGGAYALGRIGPATTISLDHDSLLQQIPGVPLSFLTMQGVVGFPSFDQYALAVSAPDGVIETSTASGRGVQRYDDHGRPLLDGTFGLGSRQSFTAEAIVALQPFAVSVRGNEFTITNQAGEDAHDCAFGEGFSRSSIGNLAAGASIAAIQVEDGPGPLFTCTVDVTAIAVTSTQRRVETGGSTRIVVYQQPPGAHP